MTAWILAAAMLTPTATPVADLQRAIDTIRATGPEGQRSAPAAAAWRALATADASSLPQVLAAMDGASAVARNWLRSAADPVILRARAEKKPLPLTDLEAFLADRHHDPQARCLAYDLIVENDATAPARLLPGLLDDPSPDLRHDAVGRLLAEAESLASAGKKPQAIPVFKSSLAFAREKDQIDKAATKLRELGQPIDLARQYGFILDWKLIGPFPNPAQKGADTAYSPEKAIDFAAAYDGSSGKVHWKDFVTPSEAGQVDLNVGIGKPREGVAYAFAEFTSDRARPVEIRMSSLVTLKLWVNGALRLERYDAYTGIRMDTYIAKAKLKQGKNEFLVKLCKDEPPEPRFDKWWFALRVCDDSGAAVLSTTRCVSPTSEKKP